jgi:hypothetical protein
MFETNPSKTAPLRRGLSGKSSSRMPAIDSASERLGSSVRMARTPACRASVP